MLRASPAVTLLALAALGCEAQTTVTTSIVAPPSFSPAALGSGKLHLQIDAPVSFTEKLHPPGGHCSAYDPKKPETTGSRVKSTAAGFELEQSAIPTVREFCLAAWFDTTANGVLDAGDAVGGLSVPYPAQPSKFFSSNRYRSPDVTLALVPTP
jgi:hypothetical protein